MKVSIIAKHKELRELSWDMPEFKRLVASGDIRRPSAFMPRLKIRVLGFTFELPVLGVVYFIDCEGL